MNVPHNLHTQYPAARRLLSIKWLVPLVVVPIVGFAIYVGWLLLADYRASQELSVLTKPIRAAGTSPEDAWIAKRFAETTSSEGTAAWSEIIMLSGSVGWNATNDLPIIGNGETLRTLGVGGQWKSQPLVDDYLKEAQPLLDLIYEAEKYPTPVWQPMDFRGFGTLLPELQESRQIARLLQLDFEHAILGNDRERAMRDLQAMQTTADAFDWDLFMVGELINAALRGMRYMAIQRSLYADVWTKEDLARLIAEAQQPLPLAQSWQRSLQAEKAMAVAYMQSPLFSPTNRLLMLGRYAEMEALADSDPGEFAIGAGRLEDQWEERHADEMSKFWLGELQPAIRAYATVFDRTERSRRLVLTSLAVKLFQLTNERWPTDLQELTQVGLQSEDWTLPGIGLLGYAVQDDGQTACVWGADETNPNVDVSGVSDECPDYAGDELDKVQIFLTMIK